MSWAGKRKALYIVIVFVALTALVAPIAYHFYPKPSCFDGKQNQDEGGIDCDGSCAKVCIEKTADLKVLFARSFIVQNGVYSAVAYVSNPNPALGARNVPYTFRFYDDKNVLIAERSGTTNVLPNTNFPVFEGLVTAGNRVPSRVFFEFKEKPRFERLSEQPVLSVHNSQFSSTDGPRLTADISNSNIFAIEDISVVALLYDSSDTVIGASATYINSIEKGGTVPVVFTWPMPFAVPISRIEIVPEFLTIQ